MPIRLDPWQVHLCYRLERLRHQRGQRLLIHAPPQVGKSIIVSQRLPAYLLGCDPQHRVKLACYNVTHSARFGRVVKEVMQSPEFSELFPSPDCSIPSRCSDEEFATAGRRALRDAQPSFKALGLVTGFVGQGADTLLIDDPYASPQDAFSEAVNASVWMFWDQSAKVRLTDDSNVVVMFHRYHQSDLAGKLYALGGWEMIRYAAQSDGDPEMPDPISRPVGEYLTPRRSVDFWQEQQKVPSIWLGQFQGRPSPLGGGIFKKSWFSRRYRTTPNFKAVYTLWDLALKDKETNDETACLTLGEGEDGFAYVLRAASGHWETPDVGKFLCDNSDWLKRVYGDTYRGDYIEDKVSGTTLMQYLRRERKDVVTIPVKVEGDKTARAKGVTPICEAGRVLWPDTDFFPSTFGWVSDFLGQITSTTFQAGLDDRADVFVYALKKYLGTLGEPRGIKRGRIGGQL